MIIRAVNVDKTFDVFIGMDSDTGDMVIMAGDTELLRLTRAKALTVPGTLAVTGTSALTGTLTPVGLDLSSATSIILGSDAAGDLWYSNGTKQVRLAKGTAGQYLQQNAGATAPEWDSMKALWSFRIPEAMTVDSDAYNGSLIYANAGDLVAAEVNADYAKVYDATNLEYQNLATSSSGAGYTADYQHVPDTPADNDAVYFGAASTPFCQLYFDVGTAVSYTGNAVTWEYFNGTSFAALSVIYDHTGNATTDGTRPFQQDGSISFVPPSDWTQVEVNTVSAYWIRARISTVASHGGENGTMNSKEHHIVFPADGFRAPHGGTITDVRIIDEAATVHTATDIKFVIFNFTKGTYTGELTFAQDKRTDDFTSQTMAVDAGDNLGVLITQEDGTNEAGPVTLELGVTLT